MKVIVSPNGEVIFETEDIAQALDMVKALRNGLAPPKKRGPYKKRVESVEIVPVSPQLVETWQWLVDNDRLGGLSIKEISDALSLKHATTTWRMNQLIQKGLVHKAKRGYYRAGEFE